MSLVFRSKMSAILSTDLSAETLVKAEALAKVNGYRLSRLSALTTEATLFVRNFTKEAQKPSFSPMRSRFGGARSSGLHGGIPILKAGPGPCLKAD